MARPLEQAAKIYLFIDGSKIGRLQDLELTSNSGKIRIDDIEQGFAGFAVGAGDVQVSGRCYVPLGGLVDFDFITEASQNGGIHEIQIPVGAKSYIGSGYFENASVTGSTSTATEVSFTFIGQSNGLE